MSRYVVQWVISGLCLLVTIGYNTADAVMTNNSNNVATPSDTLVLGRLAYRKQTSIISRFDGIIHKISVKSGELVSLNQSLVEVHGLEPGLKPMLTKNHSQRARVTHIALNEGAFVSKYQTILTLSQLTDMVVDSDILVTKLGLVKLGKEVTVMLPSHGPTDKTIELKGVINETVENGDDAITPLKIRVKLDLKVCDHELDCNDILRAGTLVFIRF